MPQTQEQLVGSVALGRVLQELEDVVVTTEPTTDPSDLDTIDEFDRLLTALYQALTDAGVQITAAQAAAALAQAKATLANNAATMASNAATSAGNAATLANTKAGYAQDKGDYAKTQGDYAKTQGNYAKQQADAGFGFDETTDPMTLLTDS